MVLIFFVVAVRHISFYRSAKSLPRAFFHSSNTFWKKKLSYSIFTMFFLFFSLELHDPIEASLESPGHGGYLCQPWGEELLKQSKWCLHSTPGCVAHWVNNSICVWKAEWTAGCCIHTYQGCDGMQRSRLYVPEMSVSWFSVFPWCRKKIKSFHSFKKILNSGSWAVISVVQLGK